MWRRANDTVREVPRAFERQRVDENTLLRGVPRVFVCWRGDDTLRGVPRNFRWLRVLWRPVGDTRNTTQRVVNTLS